MSEDTLSNIRKEGEKLLSSLERFFYSNFTGLSNKPGIEDIFSSFREFGDPGLFLSFSDTQDSEEAKDKGRYLIKHFLADMYVYSRTSSVTDKIVTLETKLKIKSEDKKIPFRSAGIKILNESKKKTRDETGALLDRALEELAPHYMERRYQVMESAEELGLLGFSGLMLNNESTCLTSLVEEAKSFLRDTDYVTREMLEWFLFKQMEIPIKDASVGDLSFMLNSFELKAAFPADEYEIPAARVLDDSGLVNSSEVNAESGIRGGKLQGSYLFLTSPPAELNVSIFPTGGPADYENYLSALGSALSFVFTDRDDNFEFRYLRDPYNTELFSELFKNLVYERTWLERYIDYERGDDFYKLLFLRRLLGIRVAAAQLIYEQSLYSGENEEALRAIYKELMENALHTEVSEWGFLSPRDIRKLDRSASAFGSLILEPWLTKYLKERFDEEWWRVPSAGAELKKIWSEGGRITSGDIIDLTGFDGTSSELCSLFERELG